jgi:hypothetical protein
MGEAMIFRAILVVGFILGMAGCADNEQAASESAEEASMGTADATAIDPVWRNESFVTHMHEHAEKLDDLNFALADGDLDTAKTAANWLSTHDTDSDIQSDWLPYLYSMRTEAEAVEAAPDIATAQGAAQRITAQCQQCHAAVGI